MRRARPRGLRLRGGFSVSCPVLTVVYRRLFDYDVYDVYITICYWNWL